MSVNTEPDWYYSEIYGRYRPRKPYSEGTTGKLPDMTAMVKCWFIDSKSVWPIEVSKFDPETLKVDLGTVVLHNVKSFSSMDDLIADLDKMEPITRLLVLENHGDVEQGSVVRLIEKNSHFSLCETGYGECWISNNILDPYFAPGEEVWVSKFLNAHHCISSVTFPDSFKLGEFVHHAGPRMGLVNVDGIIDEVFLDQLTRCKLT